MRGAHTRCATRFCVGGVCVRARLSILEASFLCKSARPLRQSLRQLLRTPRGCPGEEIAEIYRSVTFVELFAGSAGLTRAVDSAGVPVVPPDEIHLGGTDFRDPNRWRPSKELLGESAAAEGTRGERGVRRRRFTHLAPPRSTFSKAKDRSWRTRVRSRAQPIGIPPRSSKVKEKGS